MQSVPRQGGIHTAILGKMFYIPAAAHRIFHQELLEFVL
jgi:hypothetical protein